MTDYDNIDSRQLEMFMRQPGFAQSVSSSQLQGMQKRVQTARWSPQERIVYDAVQDGYTSLDSLPVATGLTSEEVKSAVQKLTGRGVVSSISMEEAS